MPPVFRAGSVAAGGREEKLSKWWDVFQFFDKDGSGAMDIAELTEAIKEIRCETISADGAQKILQKYDTDGNHQIDFEEFKQILQDEEIRKGAGARPLSSRSLNQHRRSLTNIKKGRGRPTDI